MIICTVEIVICKQKSERNNFITLATISSIQVCDLQVLQVPSEK